MGEWDTATVNSLSDASFLYVEPGGEKDAEGRTTPRSLRHFPYRNSQGAIDLPHLRNALARIPQSNLPPDKKEAIEAHARKLLNEQKTDSDERVFRYDFAGPMGQRRQTPQGGMVVDANLTRPGVFTYRQGDGSTRRELRHPDEVFHPDSLATYRNAPVTVDHPGRVDPRNWKTHAVGTVGSDVRPSGHFVTGEIHIQHHDAIDRAQLPPDHRDALREVSCGYTCDLDQTPGVYQGQPYDVAQRNIRINHVAVGPKGWGRMGPDTKMHLDARDAVCDYDDDQARAENGQWTSGGRGGGSSAAKSHEGGSGHGGGSLSERAKSWLSKTHSDVRAFFNDPKARSQAFGKLGHAIRNLPHEAVEKVKETVRKNVADVKLAGGGLRALASGQKMTDEQKHAVKKVALKVGVAVAAQAIAGGLPLHWIGTEAGKFVAEKLAHHLAEAGLERLAHAATGVELDAGDDFDTLVVKLVAAMADEAESLGQGDASALLERLAGGDSVSDSVGNLYVHDDSANSSTRSSTMTPEEKAALEKAQADAAKADADLKQARQDAKDAKTEGERLAAKAREDAAEIAQLRAQRQLDQARIAHLEAEKNDPQARARADAARQADVEELIAVRADAKYVFASATDPEAKNWKQDGKTADTVRREILAVIAPDIKLDALDANGLKGLYVEALKFKRSVDKSRADAMAAVTGARVDGKDGPPGDDEDDDGEPPPNAEKARKDMIKRKKDAWKMGRKDRMRQNGGGTFGSEGPTVGTK